MTNHIYTYHVVGRFRHKYIYLYKGYNMRNSKYVVKGVKHTRSC